MTDVTIREVTESDYDAVMAIRRPEEVFHGFDYLPDYFMMILKTPGYKGFAAVVDGKIVAFELACIIDGEKTLFTRARRVSKDYSGKGVMQVLNNHVRDYYLQFPGLQFSSAQFNNETYFKKIHLLVKDGTLNLVYQRTVAAYSGSIQAISSRLTRSEAFPEVAEVTKNDLSKIYDCPNIYHKLFPDGRLMVDLAPYRTVKSNIPYIFTERCSVFASSIEETSHAKSLLTFGSFIVCQSVILYLVDVYGSNIKALSRHLTAHLKTIKKLPHDGIYILLICDDTVDKKHCNTAATDLGLKNCESFAYKRSFCTERVLTSIQPPDTEAINLKAKL